VTTYRTTTVDGLKIFYREAGPAEAPALVLLHGFPSSSHMFRDLLPLLADRFHLIAPDYPGFGHSDSPPPGEFTYTFDHLADVMWRFLETLGLRHFSLYVQDYGAPVGFRIASRHPEALQAIITQNGNAYTEGFTSAWQPLMRFWEGWTPETEAAVRDLLTFDATLQQYTTGVRDIAHISPDGPLVDQHFLDRAGNADIQLRLFHDYQSNPKAYPAWHAYFRTHQPPTLVVWGANDPFFGPEGARAFQRDLPDSELHLLDTGHFALEEDAATIAAHSRRFLVERLGADGGR
jgi:pimeloyl-ACP methyl ester carboxylesterase